MAQRFLQLCCWSLSMLVTLVASGCMHTQSAQESLNLASVTIDKDTYPVVILGGGIAGLTASLFISQADIPCLVIEGQKVGGALAQSMAVRNWPGVFSKPGGDIVNDLKQQVRDSGVQISQETIVSVDFNQWPRIIEVAQVANPAIKRRIKALTVIIAMGAEPNLLGIPGEFGTDGYWGRGVSNCVICDGFLYKDKQVVVAGGGDAAIGDVDYMASIAKKVTLCVRKDQLKSKDAATIKKVLAYKNVTVLFNTELKKIDGDGKGVTGVMLFNNKTQQEQAMPVDAVFLAIGSHPNTALFKGQLPLLDNGCIALAQYQETSKRGVFAAGDITDQTFTQAATAIGDGCRAGLQVIRLLKQIGFAKRQAVAVDAAQEAVATEETGLLTELASEQEFNATVVQSKVPVVIDVSTPLCLSCQQMLPLIKTVATELQGRIQFVSVNLASKELDVQSMIQKLGGQPVQSVPTFICVVKGQEVARMVGEQTLDDLKNTIKKYCKVQ